MTSILIKDTTREEREQIVAESIGNINARFRAHYESGMEAPERADCGYK